MRSRYLGGRVERGVVAGEGVAGPPAVVVVRHHVDEVQVGRQAGGEEEQWFPNIVKEDGYLATSYAASTVASPAPTAAVRRRE